MRSLLYAAAASAALVTLAACGGNTGSAALPPGLAAGAKHVANVVRACPDTRNLDAARCLALIRTDNMASRLVAGYGPSDLQSAYCSCGSAKLSGQPKSREYHSSFDAEAVEWR